MNHLETCQHYFPNLSWEGRSNPSLGMGFYVGRMECLDYAVKVTIQPQGCQATISGYRTIMFFSNESDELGLTLEQVLEDVRNQWRRFAELNVLATSDRKGGEA